MEPAVRSGFAGASAVSGGAANQPGTGLASRAQGDNIGTPQRAARACGGTLSWNGPALIPRRIARSADAGYVPARTGRTEALGRPARVSRLDVDIAFESPKTVISQRRKGRRGIGKTGNRREYGNRTTPTDKRLHSEPPGCVVPTLASWRLGESKKNGVRTRWWCRPSDLGPHTITFGP